MLTSLISEDRQSMLFSATQTTKVSDLARISLRPGSVKIDIDGEEQTSTVDTLAQGYVVCESDQRFLLLYTFLSKNRKKKVIVFFSSCNSVKYHAELLNYIDVPVLELHVSLEQFCLLKILTRRRGNKNSKNARRHSSNSKMRLLGYSSVQTLLPEVWTSLRSTGLFNLTLRTTPAITSIGSDVPLGQERAGRVYFSSSKASWDSCGT
jgi:hypothetical protein